jgi:hypothetical protein
MFLEKPIESLMLKRRQLTLNKNLRYGFASNQRGVLRRNV